MVDSLGTGVVVVVEVAEIEKLDLISISVVPETTIESTKILTTNSIECENAVIGQISHHQVTIRVE